MQITTIGLDLAKSIFQVHGIDAEGNVLVRRSLCHSGVIIFSGSYRLALSALKRAQRRIIGLGKDWKLWAHRSSDATSLGEAVLNDMADAEAICEAVMRPNMRFVAVKTAPQQSVLMLHCCRALLVRQRTMLANAIRAHLAELGIAMPEGIRTLLAALSASQNEENDVPNLARIALELKLRNDID
jgi:transposase